MLRERPAGMYACVDRSARENLAKNAQFVSQHLRCWRIDLDAGHFRQTVGNPSHRKLADTLRNTPRVEFLSSVQFTGHAEERGVEELAGYSCVAPKDATAQKVKVNSVVMKFLVARVLVPLCQARGVFC